MRHAFAVFAFLLFLGSAAAQVPPPPEAAQARTPWVGERGIQETVDQIMEREAMHPPGRPVMLGWKPKRIRPDRSDLPQDPASPLAARWPDAPPEAGPPLLGPQTTGVSFTGATLATTGAFPPDVMGDVGPTQYIVAVNGRIASYLKSTGVADGVLNADMDVFFNPVRNGSWTSDPRIRYDRLTGRWFVIIINVASTNNRVLFAVSNTAVISGSTVWTFFYFQHNVVSPAGNTGDFADYPTLGLDAHALYIGANMFYSSGGFNNTTVFVVRKSSLTSGGPIAATAFRNLQSGGSGIYTPQGVDNFDAATTYGYFIGVDGAVYGRLVMRRVTDPAGTPTLSGNLNITVNATSAPQNVRHLGNTGGTVGRLSAVDDRLFQAVIRNGRLWTAHSINVDNTGVAGATKTRNAARWYEIGNLTGTPSVIQSGTVYTATPTNTTDERNYWFPSVMVSGQGHAAMGFSTAGTNEYANGATVGRLADDAAGTMQTPVLYTSSSAAYNPGGDPGGAGVGRRWGDYSYTGLDPNDDMTMWTAQEFTNSTNSYGVRVVQLLAPPPATPAVCTPDSVPTGRSSVTVTVTGTRISGSGFFDPGTGFSNRIGGSVSGGVTVTGVTYVNPTTVTLTLNTTAASQGVKDVTVTNPDGQYRTGTGILRAVTLTASLSLTQPNGGETWFAGTQQAITWTSQNLGGNVKIELSTNGGSSYSTVFASTPNDGSELWTVPTPGTPMARIRVSSLDSVHLSDASNANFTIVQPVITVASPNGSETWAAGSTQQVLWTASYGTGAVRILLSRNGGVTYPETLAASTPNDGTEEWLVTGPASAQAKVKVEDTSLPVSDASNGSFSITEAALTLTEPDGGETWFIDSTGAVRWESSFLPGNVRILLSRDGGAAWPETLAASTANDGEELLGVTGPSTHTARVRVASVAVPSLAAASGGDFSIASAAIAVTSPNGGEMLEEGTTATLGWNSVKLTGNVVIALSRDGGSAFDTLFAAAPDDGSEPWVVTGPTTAEAVLRVTSAGVPDVGDVSDGPFVIGRAVADSLRDGWNMLSVPVTVPDRRREEVFPGSVSQAFIFTPQGYAGRDTMEYGTGYWLKFPAPGLSRLVGAARAGDSVEVARGWNMIGSATEAFPADDIVQIPPGIVSSLYFAYGFPGYASSDTIRAMRAYWVKVLQEGRLVMPGGTGPAPEGGILSRRPSR
ncbi:MAG: hypothetical protein WB626_01355 [Bacteroidota bacterium]